MFANMYFRSILSRSPERQVKPMKALGFSHCTSRYIPMRVYWGLLITSCRNFYQMRVDRLRNIEVAKRNRERLKDPSLFPSVPSGGV